MSIKYYAALFALSFLMTILYVNSWHKRLDVNMTAIFLLIPIINLSFLMMYHHHQTDTAVVMLKIIYLGGCFLPWFTLMCIMNLCSVPVSRFVRTASFLLCGIVYCCVLTIGYSPYFYKSFSVGFNGTNPILIKEYGPLHNVFYACVGLFMLANFITILYCLLKKKQVSRKILYLLTLTILANFLGYVFNHTLAGTGYECMPASYVLAQIICLLIAHRAALYDAGDMVMESLAQSGDTGFVTVDFKYRYLDSNKTAKQIIPALNKLTVDRSILGEEALQQSVVLWLKRFEEGGRTEKELYTRTIPGDPPEEKIYTVRVNYLNDGRTRRGYQIFLEDDTQVRKYIALMDNYNSELEREVSEKTARILEMHDHLILGMAAMVESRDNSTGGHIRRTSEAVRILLEEMKKDPTLALTDKQCRDIVKAAPMHDLGKITVDDAILRKPGRYTPEEYALMKVHAAAGAGIVHTILKDTDDDEFRQIAENIAHYHHERIDGAGYPDGLMGDEIPLEAKVMAIADVYDALVSKRVYKEKCSFEEADRIIMSEMGTHFDARLKPYYMAARPALEAYYSEEGNT